MVIFLITRIVLGKLEFKDLIEALKGPVKKELEANGVGFLQWKNSKYKAIS